MNEFVRYAVYLADLAKRFSALVEVSHGLVSRKLLSCGIRISSIRPRRDSKPVNLRKLAAALDKSFSSSDLAVRVNGHARIVGEAHDNTPNIVWLFTRPRA